MRDRTVPLPSQEWWLRLGTNPGYSHHGQTTEADQRHLRKLRHQVGVDLSRACVMQTFLQIVIQFSGFDILKTYLLFINI